MPFLQMKKKKERNTTLTNIGSSRILNFAENTKMILHYTLRCIALISIIGGKTWQLHVSKLKAQSETKRTSGEKKARLLSAEANPSAEPKSLHPCCTPVHPADLHELHVHIHEGRPV